MRICLVVDDYLPDSIKVGAKMMHELACELKSQGHDITVVTPSPNLSKRVKIDMLDRITICRFKSGEIKNIGKIKRAMNETLLSYHAWKGLKYYFKKNPHDLIVYYSPSIFFGPLVKNLKNLWNVKSYLILRDLFPQWVIDNGILKEKSLIAKYFKYFEKINYESADTIGLMSNKNLQWFDQYYSGANNTEVLYNWTDVKQYTSTKLKYKKQLNIEGKIVFFYGGNMGYAQDIMNLVRLSQKMQKYKEAHFVFVGAGDEVELIQDFILETNAANITLLPSVNQSEFLQMLSEFEIGLFTLNRQHKTHNFPGKLLGYLVQNLAILGSINPDNDLKDILEKYNAGLISENGEDQILYENAIKLLDSEYRNRVTSNAKELLYDKFCVSKAANQILHG